MASPRGCGECFDDAPERKKARVAVVGCGGWAQGWHLPNLSNRADAPIVALVDPADQPGTAGCVPSRCEPADKLAEKYGAKRYTSTEALLADNAELKLDGLLCAAPHTSHHSVGETALRAGLHVLMEKPLTTDVAEARALLELKRARPAQALILNNTANWQEGTRTACEWVTSGRLGELKHINCLFAAPLGWLFEGKEHSEWNQRKGSMKGNGFGWGQFSHTFAWVFKVTSLVPKTVYAVATTSEATGADLFDAVIITCTNGCVINASGVGVCPDTGAKVVGNWIFGTKGMLSYCGLAGSDNVENDGAAAEVAAGSAESPAPKKPPKHRLEAWLNDGTHDVGPPVEFESLDPAGTGPGSMDAWVHACRGQEYYEGAGALEGLKAVATIDAMYRSILSGKAEPVSDPCT
jgi:predicted dehydrogenase